MTTMNHEREQDRRTETAEATHDAGVAPGRTTRTDHLIGPTGVRPSGLLMRKARDANGVADNAEALVGAAGGGGMALPDHLRSRFEGSLGTDLSGVRVHTGEASAQAAAAVGAKAYTLGNDVHFGAGHYDPSSATGQHLLAHEVAHTVQQRGGAGGGPQFKLEVSSPGDAFEHEADRAAEAMVSGAPAQVGGASGLGRVVQRKAEVGATGGAKLGGTAAAITLPITTSIPIKASYFTITLGLKGQLEGTLDWGAISKMKVPDAEFGSGGSKTSGGGQKEGVDGGFVFSEHELTEAKKETAKQATEEAKKSWWEESVGGEWKITHSAKLGTEKEDGKRASKVGYVVTIAGKFKNGATASIDLNVLTLGAEEGTAHGQVLGVTFGASAPPYKFEERTLSSGAKVSGTLTTSASASVAPNWGAIWKGLIKQGGQQALQAAEKTAVEAAEAGVGVSAAAAAFAIGMFVGIGGSTVAALVMGAKEIAEWDEVVKQRDRGAEGFATGVMSALGVAGGLVDGAYTLSGAAHGLQKLNEVVAKAKAIPSVKEANLSDAEIREAICGAAAKHSADLRGAMVSAAREQIGEALVRDYYKRHKDDWFFTKSDAQGLAHTMGLEKGHDIDLSDHGEATGASAE